VAQYKLPFSFKVLPRIRPAKPPPPGKLSSTRGKRKQQYTEQSDEQLSAVNQRNVRARSARPPQRNPSGSESINHSLPDNPRDTPQGSQHQGASSPPLITSPRSPRAGISPDPPNSMKTTNQTITPPRTDGEPVPTLTEVNPESGSITGGARIWLKGVDFPPHFPLYARFGASVVPTVSLLTCL